MKKQILVLLLMGTMSSLLGAAAELSPGRQWIETQRREIAEGRRSMDGRQDRAASQYLADLDALERRVKQYEEQLDAYEADDDITTQLAEALRARSAAREVQKETRQKPQTSAKPKSCATCGNKGKLCKCSSSITPSLSPEACNHTGACGCGVRPAGSRAGRSSGIGARWEEAQKDRPATFAQQRIRENDDENMAIQVRLDQIANLKKWLRATAASHGVDFSKVDDMDLTELQKLRLELEALNEAKAAEFVEPSGADVVMDPETAALIEKILASEKAAQRFDIGGSLDRLKIELASLEAVLLLPDISREDRLITEAQISVLQGEIGDLESKLMFMDQK